MPDAPLTCLDFWCRAGSAEEKSGEEGMAHFLEHMLFKGSRQLPPGAFDQAIEALGGSSNAATGFDDVHFHVLIPPDRTSEALDHLLELVLQPSFQPNGFATEREVVLEEIAQYADQPSEQVLQQLLSRGCGDHPYGRPILGDPNTLRRMTPEAMQRFHQRLYQGGNCTLAMAGPDIDALHEIVSTSQLADMPAATGSRSSSNHLKVQSGHHELCIDRLESGRLLMLWAAAPALNQVAMMGADLATTLLGEGRRSRLVNHLREDLQLVESVTMDLTALEQGSLITLEAICPADALAEVEREVTTVLRSMADQAVSQSEYHRASQLVSNGLRFLLNQQDRWPH